MYIARPGLEIRMEGWMHVEATTWLKWTSWADMCNVQEEVES